MSEISVLAILVGVAGSVGAFRGLELAEITLPERRKRSIVLAWLAPKFTLLGAGVFLDEDWTTLLPLAALLAVMPVLGITDIMLRRLPDRYTLGLLAAAGWGMAISLAADTAPSDRFFCAMVVAGGWALLLLATHLISPQSVGFGDVKLAPAVGAIAGWGAYTLDWGIWLSAAVSVFLIMVLASLAGFVLMLSERLIRRKSVATNPSEKHLESQDTQVPYGPAMLCAAMLIAFLPAVTPI